MLSVLGFLASPWGRIASAFAAVAAFLTYWTIDQRNIGEQRVVVKMERADNALSQKSSDARARSFDDTFRGVRDPNSVSE